MGFAIKCYFTPESAKPIYEIWDHLAKLGLASFLKDSQSRPGITLGLWENASDAHLREALAGFRETPPPIEFYGLGSFPTDPAQVFLGATPSAALLTFHKKFHETVRIPGGSHYYQPGSWVPHSTLALRCERGKVGKIMEACLSFPCRFEARISSIGIVETGTARQVYEMPL